MAINLTENNNSKWYYDVFNFLTKSGFNILLRLLIQVLISTFIII